MTPALAILRALVDPRGRANRTGFMLTLTTAGVFGQGLLLYAGDLALSAWALTAVQGGVLWLHAVPCMRRLHDVDRSGWHVWLALPLLFMWAAVISIGAATLAVAFGANGLAMLDAGRPLYYALAAFILLPVAALVAWLALIPGRPGDSAFGLPPALPFGLSFPPPAVRSALALRRMANPSSV